MSSVTPGRETDALVAEKLGWSHIGPNDPYRDYVGKHGGVIANGSPQKFRDRGVIPDDFRPSGSTADAIAALESTGESWTLCFWPDMHEAEENGTPYRVVLMPKNPTVCAGCGHQKRQDIEGYGETLCTAICAAILQLRGEG